MDQARPHILVVDDQPAICEVIRECLVGAGFRVTAATDAAEAERTAASMPVDLVLVDLLLSGSDGFGLAATLSSRGIDVVTMSGHPEAVRKVQDWPYPHLAKPFRLQTLLDLVRERLKSE